MECYREGKEGGGYEGGEAAAAHLGPQYRWQQMTPGALLQVLQITGGGRSGVDGSSGLRQGPHQRPGAVAIAK